MRRTIVLGLLAAGILCGCNLFTEVEGGSGTQDAASTSDVKIHDAADPSDASGGPIDSGGRDLSRDQASADVGANDQGADDMDNLDLATPTDAARDAGPSDMGPTDGSMADLGAPDLGLPDASDASDAADLPPTPAIIPFEHQPPGGVVVAEHDFSFLPSQAGAPNPIAGFWKTLPSVPQPDLALAADATEPASPSSAVRITMPQGMTDGSRDWWFEAWDNAYPTYPVAYFSMFVKLEGTDFENDGGLFLAFISAGIQGPGQDRRVEVHVAPGSTPRGSAFQVRMVVYEFETFTLARTLPQNMDLRPLVTAGEWHQFEMLVENNTLGSADGKVSLWVDGILVVQYSDVEIQTAAYAGDLGYYLFYPGWMGTTPRDDADDYLVDHVRVVGVP